MIELDFSEYSNKLMQDVWCVLLGEISHTCLQIENETHTISKVTYD